MNSKYMRFRSPKLLLAAVLTLGFGLLGFLQLCYDLLAQVFPKNPPLDRSRPVPSKDEVISAWRKRQDAFKSFRFAWTEQQTHPQRWLPNPRYPMREWSNTPALFKDRTYSVSKTLDVDGNSMRYSFELDRKPEPDGVRINSPQGDTKGLGEGKHYSYLSVFDGQIGRIRLTSLADSPPPVASQSVTNADAQNLDTRPLLITFRPLDPLMGHLLIDRAVTNQMRTFYKGRSTFLLEEQRDPSGWKTILRIAPEQDFAVLQFLVLFEQRLIVEVNIDYVQDAKWGWIPSAWQVSQLLDDGSMRLLSDAKVTSYSINEQIRPEEFK